MIHATLYRRDGYIALTSLLILVAVIGAVVFTLSLIPFFLRANILNAYLKDESYALAESCVQVALLRLVDNASYGGSETVTVSGGNTCRVISVVDAGSVKTISVRGEFQGAATNLAVAINDTTFVITNWQEVPRF